jgi:hypothetical protein
MDKRNIEVDIAEDHEWVERIDKTAYDPAQDRIKLNE